MLNAIRDTAEMIARQAGVILQDYATREDMGVDYKTTSINVVTAADKAAEQYITSAIQSAYPDHFIHGEEGGGYGPSKGAPFGWYVDPVDGTTNFAHGFPFYCVNLSVVNAQGEPVVGITYDPIRDECFSAVLGQGATLNNKPIHVSSADSLVRALLATGFPYDSHTARDNNTAAFDAFNRRAQSIRRAGAAALDIAYVACGRVDGYWERGPEPWDMLAGMLMVSEAGGKVTDYSGGTEGLAHGGRFVASNGLLHSDMIAVLAGVQAALDADES